MPKVRERSTDVQSSSSSFSDLLLSEPLQEGLRACGFHKPSPVQLAAIPLGRFGVDLIVQGFTSEALTYSNTSVQAKSGTGKTATFASIVAERVQCSRLQPQALILSPTREIAQQSAAVIQKLGHHLPPDGLRTTVCVGGLSYAQNVKELEEGCHVVVGTPGQTFRSCPAKVVFHLRALSFATQHRVMDADGRCCYARCTGRVRALLEEGPLSADLLRILVSPFTTVGHAGWTQVCTTLDLRPQV
eukprot:1191863-Prorocentrum_minimum.AAC.2